MPDTTELEHLIAPYLSGLFILVLSLWFRDLATKMAKGLAFKLDKNFNEGDQVILDGSSAVIIKIGMTTTVFGLYKTEQNSSDVKQFWRYVPNERIPYLTLEKVISDNGTTETA